MSLGESAFNRDARQDSTTENYLTVSQVAVGAISSAADKDWYEVYLVAGVNYAAAWAGQAYGATAALANATMTLRNASGAVQPVTQTAAPPTGSGGGIGFQVATSGKYYIEIDGTGASDLGAYLIQLGRTAFGDDYGSNFQDAGQIKPGLAVTGAMQTAGDNDAFVLNVTAGSRYFYYVTTSVPDLAYTLDTPSLQRAGFGFLSNGQFGEVTATVTTSALLSVFSDSYVGAGSYTLFAEKAYSTDRVLKIDTTGVNSYTGTAAAEEVWGFGGDDNFNGGDGNDILVGGTGNDKLNGGAGGDRMIGGAGNDTYTIDNVADTIEETATSGSLDIANTSISYALAAKVRVETLQTTSAAGTTAINLTGNEFGQTIVGNNGANTILGKGGADTIKGGAGGDTLKGDGSTAATGDGADKVYGGAGNDFIYGGRGNDTLRGDDTATQRGLDRFYFDTALNSSSNHDTILDFNPVDDGIYLKKSGVFAGIASLGTLAGAAFKQIDNYDPANPGARTPTTDDYRIIYDKVSGKLYYDADGHGGTATALWFATVNNGTAHPTLTNADFIVY
jgi:Ca2+-binding RTX toxin-like protein